LREQLDLPLYVRLETLSPLLTGLAGLLRLLQLLDEAAVIIEAVLELFSCILQFLFEGNETAEDLLLTSEVVLDLRALILELSVLVPEFVDALIHDADVFGLQRAALLVLLVLLACGRRLLLQRYDVLVEQLDLLGVRLN
jgi:hypothetical protein